jgi:ATP-binding protein involved in chromosome partitioning
VPLLGSVPLQPQLAELADAGQPVIVAQPESPAAVALRGVAEELQQRTSGRTVALPILRG